MQTTLRHRIAASAAVLALASGLSACSFNQFNEQTDKVYQPAVGTDDRSGTVDVLAAVVVSPSKGHGNLIFSLSNNDEVKTQTLESVKIKGAQVGSRSVEIKGGELVNLAVAGGFEVTASDLEAGQVVKARLEFGNGQSVTMSVPVVRASGVYADLGSAVPTAEVSPSTAPEGPTPSSGASSSTPSSSNPSGVPSPTTVAPTPGATPSAGAAG